MDYTDFIDDHFDYSVKDDDDDFGPEPQSNIYKPFATEALPDPEIFKILEDRIEAGEFDEPVPHTRANFSWNVSEEGTINQIIGG